MNIQFKKEVLNELWLTDWIKAMNEQLGSNIAIDGHQIVFPENVAVGDCSYYLLAEGLEITIFNMEFKVPLTFERLATKENDFYTLHINCSAESIDHCVEGIENKIGGSSFSSLYWSSSDVRVTFSVEAGKKMEAILICMSKDYLHDALSDLNSSAPATTLVEEQPRTSILQNDSTPQHILLNEDFGCELDLKEYIFSKSLYTQMGIEKFSLVREILSYDKSSVLPETLMFTGNILKILALFVKRIDDERNKNLHNRGMVTDTAKIVRLKKLIDEKAETRSLKLTDFAKYVNMSTSNMKKKFKEIVGKSIYQYYLERKMQKAKELVYNNSNSITHIAYSMGFNNASHFSYQFKKHHGVSPIAIKNLESKNEL